MSKNSTVTIACALCVGAAPEFYLPAMLTSIREAVDVLVVNENSGLADTENLVALERSAFAERGALHVARGAFVDFADMRNRAFEQLKGIEPRPDWVLFIDADEVHGEQIRYIARELLPRLGADVGSLDGYTYHFFGTYRWVTDIARRLMFYRYDPSLRWSGAIHEKLQGLCGRSLVIPYIYHHYGNVATPRVLADKYERYHRLGNPVPPREDPESLDIYLEKLNLVRPYGGAHPAAARETLRTLEAAHAATLAGVDAAYRSGRTPAMRLAATLRGINERTRVALRRVEHPGLFPGPTVAR
jgi:hypothetical protein